MRRFYPFWIMLLAVLTACTLPQVSVSWPTETATEPVPTASQTVSELTETVEPGIAPLPAAAGVVTAPAGGGILSFFDPAGSQIGQVMTPNLLNASPENVHVAGGVSGGVTTPVVFFTIGDGENIMVNESGEVTTLKSTSFFASMLGVPAQPILAYSTAELTGTGLITQLFVGTLQSLPTAASSLTLEGSEIGAIQPLAILAPLGAPVGVWYTQRAWGIGGDIVFSPTFGLYYLDLGTGATSEYLSRDYRAPSMSSDQTWVAYSSGGQSVGALTIRHFPSGQNYDFTLLSSSDRGAGYGVFSPENQYVAWMEASGSMMNQVPDYHPTLRIGTTSGTLVGDYVDSYFDAAVGFDVQWLLPVGWLDETNVVLQLRGLDWDNSWVLSLDINTGRVVPLSAGSFVGFYYP